MVVPVESRAPMEGKAVVDGWLRSTGITHSSQMHAREQGLGEEKEEPT